MGLLEFGQSQSLKAALRYVLRQAALAGVEGV